MTAFNKKSHLIKILFNSSLTLNLIKPIWTRFNDFVLNIDTIQDLPLRNVVNMDRPWQDEFSDKSKYNDNNYYESPDYWYIRKIARILRPRADANEVFYDLGSGKGRILCVMAQWPFKKVVGMELFENLCEVAKRNATYMRGRKAPIEIVCEDATRADLSDGTVYCMFNPFGAATLREVIEHIKGSMLKNPRKITIIYYNAVHEDILRSCEWLQMSYVFHTATGRRVSFWRNLNSEHA